MPTINRALNIPAGDSVDDVLQGTIIQSLGPGIHRIKLSAAADADVEHSLKVDSENAVDDGLIFPELPLNPTEDKVFMGFAEGGSNLLYSVDNNSANAAVVQVQFEVERAA